MSDRRQAPREFTLVFPMAGRDAYSGYKYKPFMRLGEKTFIETAYESFVPWTGRIQRVVFACLREQEEQFDVRERLRKLFPDLVFDLIVLPEATAGPYATITQAVTLGDLSGPSVICDCDHALELSPFFDHIDRLDEVDCVLPTWSLRGENLKNWAVAAVDDEIGRVRAIAEKRIPQGAGTFVGVIGCYYFADLARLPGLDVGAEGRYVSDAIHALLRSSGVVHAVPIARALFYGDQIRLQKARAEIQTTQGTIFCDIDGTVIEHQDTPRYDRPLEVLPGAVEKIQEWIRSGFNIVLTTSRNPLDEPLLRQFLADAGVPYHKLVTGLPSGPRYLVNDRKPSALFQSQVGAFEVERNQGIRHIKLPDPCHLHVVRRFQGGSLAETLLLQDEERFFVRKRVSKGESLAMGFAKLKHQYRMLERFSHLEPALIPELYGDHDDSLEYFYDLEFLPGHRPLSEFDDDVQRSALTRLLGMLGESIYCRRAPRASGAEWLERHLADKVFPKLDSLCDHPRLGRLVRGGRVLIDGEEYPTLWDSLTRLTDHTRASRFEPRYFCLTHGDMAFGNILLHDDNIKLIDMDCGSAAEPPESDLGKLFQSLIVRYEQWAGLDGSLVTFEGSQVVSCPAAIYQPDPRTVEICVERWARILGDSPDQVYEKGLFFMGLHLVRMIPYRMKAGEDQALFALVCAVKWLGKLVEARLPL